MIWSKKWVPVSWTVLDLMITLYDLFRTCLYFLFASCTKRECGCLTNIYTGRFRPEVQTLNPNIAIFDREDIPLSHTYRRNTKSLPWN